jgi:SSS family solute:Na+ symporter
MHEWKGVMHASTNPMGIDIIGVGMGLGFVLGSGYWCTDFLVIQTAMASHNMESARRVPLIAAVPKMLFPFLVILPGLLATRPAHAAHHNRGAHRKRRDLSRNQPWLCRQRWRRADGLDSRQG